LALSMDEQRILAQIEEQLASGDPDLAARLSSFGRSGTERVLRLPRPRPRLAGPAAGLVAVAIVSLIVYALVPFRTLPDRGVTHGHPVRAVMTARSTQRPASPQVTPPAAAHAHSH
jgi:hypothetical protein